MNVSALLITYKRRANVGPIVTHLLNQPFIGEVLIRDQEKEENLRCYGRYLLARQASHGVCFFCDDDCIIKNIDEIYEAYLADPDRIAFGLAPTHYPLWQKGTFRYPNAELAMVGWGAFVKREWCAEETFAPYVAAYGADPMLFREADRVFSLMLKRWHTPILAEVEHLTGNSDDDAMWKEEEHFRSRDEAIKKCLRVLR